MALGYKDTQKALFEHLRPKQKTTLAELQKVGPPVGPTFLWPFSDELSYDEEEAVYVSEYGAYDLALKSKLPIGDSFQVWLAEKVIPSIRETGQRKLEEKLILMDKEIAAKKQLIELKEKVLELSENLAYYDETKHVFQRYNHVIKCDKYYFVRTHHAKLYKATKKLNPEKYALMFERTNLPNSMDDILNKLK